MMRMVEVEFEDEVEIKGQDHAVLVEIEARGEIDKDLCVHNVKIVSIYSKDHNKTIPAKELTFSDMKRVMEKTSDKLVEEFQNNYDANFTEFDEDYYVDTSAEEY